MSIDIALCLPAPDVEALRTGELVTVLPKTFIHIGRQFALYPSLDLTDSPSLRSRYQPSFLPTARNVIEQMNTQTVSIKAWARCELCQILDDVEALPALARLSIWKVETLEKILLQQKRVFLAFLRVYELPISLEVVHQSGSQFISLPQSINVENSSPILSDRIFEKRKWQLENLEPPEHPELEELYSAIARLGDTNPNAKGFEQAIRQFLGWAETSTPTPLKPGLSWTHEIVELGHRSKEQDDGRKSNYQAGTDFENIVRKSLEFLGFKVDDAYKGGAGGLDLFCSKPFPLVGECKAGKRIPSGTTEELLKLGGMHLDPDDFRESAKLIIGPGSPTTDVITAATKWKISIIGPMSLQKLVELQAKHPGSVNLWELKKYLEPGQIDAKVDEFIEQVLSNLRLRAEIIHLVKKFLETSKQNNADAAQLHAIYSYSNPSKRLEPEEMREILVELSSPLTGYLGRKKENGSDRFYFLRDLVV